MRINKKYITYIISMIIVILFLYFVFRNIDKIKEILFPIFISILIAYLVNPFVSFFEDKGIKRVQSIIIVYFLLLCIMALTVLFIFPIITNEMSSLFKILPGNIDDLTYKINDIKNNYLAYLPKEFSTVLVKRTSMLNKEIASMIDASIQSIISLTGHILNLILTPIITFYLLKDKDILKSEIKEIIPENMRGRFSKILKDLDSVMSKYIRGQIYISIIVTVLTSIGLMIIKVKYSVLIGILAGILNIIPYFGPILGSIPAIVMGLIDSLYKGIWAFVIFFLVQQIESAFFAPKIMSDSVDLHPITVIVALLVGEQFFGIWGMLLSVPVVAMIKVILKDVFIEV